jgi:hypothetical protein
MIVVETCVANRANKTNPSRIGLDWMTYKNQLNQTEQHAFLSRG